MSDMWRGTSVLVTGGASFIGSHLVDALVERHARVRVIDDLSSGQMENLRHHLDTGAIEFIEGDLKDGALTRDASRGVEVIFHLAADHGGRGYVDLHQANCSTNLALDSIVIQQAHRAGVKKVVYASSGCVYPNHLQTDPSQILYLTEDMVGPPYNPDGMYGLAKLAGELSLKAFYQDYGLPSAACRYFTVYGPRGVENHAVMAMIARAFIGVEEFEVWGTGEQIRNWTYVDDIVRGTILAAEKIDDATPINLGTMERVRVVDAVRMALKLLGHEARLVFRPDMPTGPYNRVADNRRARELLGWEPQVPFVEGLRRTAEWYRGARQPQEVRKILGHMLTGRGALPASTA